MKKYSISRWLVFGSALVIIIYATSGTLLAMTGRVNFAQANGTATTEAANATIQAALTAALTATTAAVATPTLDINATLAALQTREAAVNATLTALAPTNTPTPTETPTPTRLPSTPRTSIELPTPNATASAANDAIIESAVAATLTAVAPPATATSTPPHDFTIEDTWTNLQDGAVYVYVPAGEFTMGSLEMENEKPVHKIRLDSFWIMQMEVTNSQYAQCVEAGVCSRPHNSIWNKPEFAVHPVANVNWDDANAYAAWVEGRLPTEAEWEKAARGDDGRVYPWGNTWRSSRLNYCDAICSDIWKDTEGTDGYAETAAVGSYLSGKSPYGALDMAGNVREWTSTRYADYPYTANDGRENLATRGSRVVRGGSWRKLPPSVRTTRREGEVSSQKIYSDLGFRVVRNQLPIDAVISIPTPVSTPQITIPLDFTPVRDDLRGYSLAVPLGWNPLDLRSTQFQNMATTFGMGAQIGSLDGFLGSEAGQGFGVIYITDLTATLFGGLPTGLNVSVIDAPGATQAWAMQMLDAQLKANPAMLNDVEIRDLGPATVNNLPAVKGSATANLAQVGINATIFVQIVGLIANDKIYVLTLATTEQNMDKYRLIFDQIIGTFRPE